MGKGFQVIDPDLRELEIRDYCSKRSKLAVVTLRRPFC